VVTEEAINSTFINIYAEIKKPKACARLKKFSTPQTPVCVCVFVFVGLERRSINLYVSLCQQNKHNTNKKEAFPSLEM